jgi:hypothetical protein
LITKVVVCLDCNFVPLDVLFYGGIIGFVECFKILAFTLVIELMVFEIELLLIDIVRCNTIFWR